MYNKLTYTWEKKIFNICFYVFFFDFYMIWNTVFHFTSCLSAYLKDKILSSNKLIYSAHFAAFKMKHISLKCKNLHIKACESQAEQTFVVVLW